MSDYPTTGATGGVRALLRLEGLMLFTAALLIYAHSGASWRLFFALILVPDLTFIAFIFGPRIGAIAYNAMHSTAGPIALALASPLLPESATPLVAIALIWFAHIGFDRALGYGLKYATGFSDTHLGAMGKSRKQFA
ncbi:MAG TPA: DUF4260 domain-containing protein [Rhizomicrobium sp.]|nr:DUF4260 domain-containing protein [Rhizomicrobium sp.]